MSAQIVIFIFFNGIAHSHVEFTEANHKIYTYNNIYLDFRLGFTTTKAKRKNSQQAEFVVLLIEYV